MTTEKPHNIHQGRNIKRFREMMGIKQEALAYQMGDDWTQKKVSLLEQKEIVEEDILQQVSKILGVTPEAIKSFDEEKAVNIIANTFQDDSVAFTQNYKCNINPIDKWMEALDEIKSLYNENKTLYERLLLAEKEKNELLKGNKAE